MYPTGPGSDSRPGFRAEKYSWSALARTLLALVSCGAMLTGLILQGGAGLVLCVWMDAITGWIGRRKSWAKTKSDIEVEGFADAVCFIVAPALMLAAAVEYRPGCMAALPVFVLAGLWRLARFNVEGMTGGGYSGLPVTYNGYLIPAAVSVDHFWPALPDAAWYAAVLVILSLLMVSRRFVTPEL